MSEPCDVFCRCPICGVGGVRLVWAAVWRADGYGEAVGVEEQTCSCPLPPASELLATGEDSCRFTADGGSEIVYPAWWPA